MDTQRTDVTADSCFGLHNWASSVQCSTGWMGGHATFDRTPDYMYMYMYTHLHVVTCKYRHIMLSCIAAWHKHLIGNDALKPGLQLIFEVVTFLTSIKLQYCLI